MEEISAETVSIGNSDTEEKYFGKIILGTSKDNLVHYEKSPYIRQLSGPKNDFRLLFESYTGKIFLPKTTSIDILTDIEVTGKINFPTLIMGKGEVNLEIEKGSGLELCVETKGPILINTHLKKFLQHDRGFYLYGRNFETLTKHFQENQEYTIRKKAITDEDIWAEYPRQVSEDMIDVCYRYNLLFIKKTGGVTNVKYFIPNAKVDDIIGRYRDNIKYLIRSMSKALLDENYEKAIIIRDKIAHEQQGIDFHIENEIVRRSENKQKANSK